ncbi:Asp23/Gls24 family envelope stress response protein [Embleya sp. NBC_00896]|uniref:Asp23/Gls24 family envelope stress response protein n=1 Tax=Embleya sp. NBC_00896 TaxID=2975961 RepID=UPI00386E4839|nr:Asp23/Gls24 family envelope stress response protein [Embleya sp. NBC_00896]
MTQPATRSSRELSVLARTTAGGAALAVPGVVGLQPGLLDAVAQVSGGLIQGRVPGVTTRVVDGVLHVDVQFRAAASRRVLDVAREVRAAVAAEVSARTGHKNVVVHILVTDAGS